MVAALFVFNAMGFSVPRNVAHPLFIFPALLLALSVGLFGFIEYRMQKNDEAIRDMVNDSELELTAKVQADVPSIYEAFEEFLDLGQLPERQTSIQASLQTKLSELNQEVASLEALFNKSDDEKTAHQVELQITEKVRRESGRLAAKLVQKGAWDEASASEARKGINAILEGSHALGRSVTLTRQSEVARFTDDISSDERFRTLLLLADILCAVVLIGALYRNSIRFKRTAQLAWATERYNAFYAAALQSIRVGVLIRDMQRKGTPVLFVNHAFTEMTGYDLGYMADKRSDILFGWHTDSAKAEAFRQAIQEEKARDFDLLIYRKNGSSFWCDWRVSPVHDQAGKLTHYISLLTDITAIRQTQDALILAKEQAEHANAVKTSFLATMSHEIRTPINGLLGVLDLLGETSLSEDQRRYVNIAINSSQSLHSIINDILDYAKMEAGKIEIIKERFSLRELLQSVVDLSSPVAMRKGLDLKLDIQDDAPNRLEGDSGKIRQILLNLVMNALKFTDTGSVEIRILHLLTQEKQGRQVALLRFEINDTGIGISAVDQDKLFKEFSQIERSFTRRFGGTGLGLAISRRLVTMMDGEIGLESKPGHGSQFWFMIPVFMQLATADSAKDRQAAPTEKVAFPASSRTILLVEDNETNQLVASRYLQKTGLQTDVAGSGQEALERALRKQYDMIFMDISMTEMDGFETTRRLRAMGGWAASVPIVALTAHVMQGDRERCLVAGMNDHLEKPVNFTSLVRMLSRWLPRTVAPELLETLEPALAQKEKAPVSKESAAPYASQDPDKRVENERPVFEPKVLCTLAEDLGGEAVLKITELYLADSEKRVKILEEDGAAANRESVRDVAHTLKSSSASCGLLLFSSHMAAIEAAAQAPNEEKLRDLLKDVGSLYGASRAALREGREAYQGSLGKDAGKKS